MARASSIFAAAAPARARRPAREAAKDALRAACLGGDARGVERRARALETFMLASERANVERTSEGVWRVAYTNAPAPSNGRLGVFSGASFQVVDATRRRYSNVLSVPPENWLRCELRARWDVLEDDALWLATFESVEIKVFDRFVLGKKVWGEGEVTRVWRTTYVDDDVRVVRAARTREAEAAGAARGRRAREGEDCLFVMTKETPWWEIPTGV